MTRNCILSGTALLTLMLATPVLAQTTGGDVAQDAGQDAGSPAGQDVAAALDIGPELITVTATRRARPLFETPSAVSVLDREAIGQFDAVAYSDVLEGVPGTALIGGPRRIAEEPNLRGFQDTQVVLRIDGARLPFDAAHRGRIFVDPDLLQRIEVVRGSASALYGSGAIGGVLALETADAGTFLREGESYGARVRLGYQSNGEEPLLSGQVFGRTGSFDALVGGLWRDTTDDLEDGAGQTILDSRETVTSGVINLGWQPAPAHEFRIIADTYDNEGPSPTNATAESTPSTVTERDTAQYNVRTRYRYGGEMWTAEATGYWSQVDLSEDRISDGRVDETEVETLGVDAFAGYGPWRAGAARVDLIGGIEAYRVSQEGRRDGGPRPQFPDAEIDFTAVYAQAEITLFDTIDIIPGLRWDRYEQSPEGNLPSREEDQITPRLALGWAPAEPVYLFASYARAFRAPSLTELYADGVHFTVPLAPGQVVINEFVPNPDLEPEVADTFEIGARLRGSDLLTGGDYAEISLTAFHSEVEDFIDQRVIFISGPPVFTPPFGPLTFPGQTINLNIDEATLQGLELTLAYETPRLSASLTGTLTEGEGEDDQPLGTVPQDRLTLDVSGLIFEDDRFGAVRAGGRWTVTATRDDVPEGGIEGEAYGVVDAFLSWAPREDISLRLVGDNILDRDYRIYPNGLPQPGRSFRFSAAWRFGA